MQISKQPILWQQCDAYSYTDTGQQLHVMYTARIKLGEKKYNLSHFDHGNDWHARQASLSISITADLLEFLHTLEFIQNSV